MYKYILFDFDGTIADSFDNFLVIANALAVKYKFEPIKKEDHEVLRTMGPQELIKRMKVPLLKLPFIARDMKAMQQKAITTIKPVQGMPQTLNQLNKHGYQLGILTSNAKPNVETFLKNNDINIFDQIVSDSSFFGKASLIKRFLKQNELANADVLYVGDEIRDIQACKDAGVAIASVAWGFNSSEGLKQHNPDYLIESPSTLANLLVADQQK